MSHRYYETITIVNPHSGMDGIKRVVDRMRDAISRTEGKEVSIEDWGVRQLAYYLQKQARGHYIYLTYLGSNVTVAELERLHNITEDVLKYQTIVLETVDAETFDFAAAKESTTAFAKRSHLEGTTLGEPLEEEEEPEVEAEAEAEVAEVEETAAEAPADEEKADA